MIKNSYSMGELIFAQPVNEFDEPIEKTPMDYPYRFDGHIIWRGGENKEANHTIYSDRLLRWDFDKHDKLCQKYWGNCGQMWDDRDPAKVEQFLRDFNDCQDLRLIFIMKYCNASNGFPVWRFDVNFPKED